MSSTGAILCRPANPPAVSPAPERTSSPRRSRGWRGRLRRPCQPLPRPGIAGILSQDGLVAGDRLGDMPLILQGHGQRILSFDAIGFEGEGTAELPGGFVHSSTPGHNDPDAIVRLIIAGVQA